MSFSLNKRLISVIPYFAAGFVNPVSTEIPPKACHAADDYKGVAISITFT